MKRWITDPVVLGAVDTFRIALGRPDDQVWAKDIQACTFACPSLRLSSLLLTLGGCFRYPSFL